MQMDTGVSQLGLRCQQISSAMKDYEFLTALNALAVSYEKGENNVTNTSPSEHGGIKTLFKILGRLSRDCGNLWTVSEDNDWLVLYLFFRCYGWKDIDFNDVRSQILVPSATKRYRNLSKDEELKMKDRIISVSKELINLIKELPLTLTGLKMFLSSIHLARGMHQTRKEIALHAVEWLTFGLQTDGGGVKAKTGFQSANKNSLTQPFLPEDSTPESMFMTVKDLIWICCTDGNRTIRIETLGALNFLFIQLSVNTIVRLIKLSLEVLEKPEVCASEATEGVVDMLNLLLKRLLPSELESYTGTPSSENETLLKNNICRFSTDFLHGQLFPRLSAIALKLFCSNYLHVRKAAVRAYLTCLKRCSRDVFDETLREVVKQLCMNTDTPSQFNQENLPSKPQDWKNTPGLYESLLDLCRIMIKKVGESNLPANTGELQNCVVDFYLGHSSENVRNSACNLFLTLIISAAKNPNRLRYLLNKVLENWQVRQDIVLSPIPKMWNATNETEKGALPTWEKPLIVRSRSHMMSWTWREGRMRTYCSVARALVGLHLKVLCELDTEGCSTTMSGQFCTSPTFTDNRSSFGFSPDRLSQTSLSPVLKSRPSLLIIDGERHSSISKPLQIIDGLPSVFRQRRKSNSLQKFMCLTVLENVRMIEMGEKAKQLEVSKAQTWLRKLSTAQPFSSIGKVNNSRVELDSISMKSILFSMLQHCTECLLDENAELHRTAKKAFYDIGRLIRCYDADLLLELISSHMLGPPTMMSYATLILLRDGLSELCQYDEILQKEEQEPGFTERYASIGTIPILNGPLLYGLFSPDKSRLWLRSCQQYMFNTTVPMFIGILSMECTLRCLCLMHRLSNLSLVACTWESMRPDPFSNLSYTQRNLEVDPSDVAECVRGFVEFVQRMDVKLGPKYEPILVSFDATQLATTIKPSLSCLQLTQSTEKYFRKESLSRNNPLTSIIFKLVTKMETIICPYLPPVLNSSRPDAKVRHTGGLLLSPILPYLITWPLALLPPDFDANSVILPREVRILAVRKVLRLIAAIVISLPIANQSKVKSNEQGVSKYANDLLNELESNAEDAVNLTTVADAYFAQLEKLILQLHQCYDRASMCTTTSWWWVRALCEHLPRLTQIAPFSNPVNLLRHLIEEARMKFNLTTEAISSTGYQSKPPNLWKKALDYGRQEARHRLKQKKSTEVLGYRWPKVGEILRAKESIEQQYIKESKMRSKTQSEAPSPSSSDAVSSPQSEDQHRFFVASDDEDDLACTQQEEIVDSSDEENCNANQFHKLQRLQSLFYITLKAEPIETPPALKDVAELVERVLLHCQPVAVSTIRQILSDSDSVFTPSLEKSMSNLMKSTEMR